MIAVVNYGGGNLKSITNMLEKLDFAYIVTDKEEEILSAKKVIFPGQGHFEQSMNAIKAKKLDFAIKKAIEAKIPFFGICVGLQVLFEGSEEAPNVDGLGVFKGKVVKYTQGKVPQIGWNKLKTTENNTFLTDDYYYFVNSYYVQPEDSSIVSAYANYHNDFAAAIEKDNVIATQFHTEKSGQVGFDTLKKWLNS